MATIYCPDGNPDVSLFQAINNLSDSVMFVGDFNSKLESFGCAKKSASGPMLKNIQKQFNLIYLNNDEHTHMDRSKAALIYYIWRLDFTGLTSSIYRTRSCLMLLIFELPDRPIVMWSKPIV